jgi:hypothetical protein
VANPPWLRRFCFYGTPGISVKLGVLEDLKESANTRSHPRYSFYMTRWSKIFRGGESGTEIQKRRICRCVKENPTLRCRSRI